MGKMTQVERMMRYQGDTEIAKEKMLQAESSIENYFRGPVHDIELGKQLIDAANAASREYLSQFAVLWPTIYRLREA